MRDVVLGAASLIGLAAVTLPFVFIGCKIGDAVEWVLNGVLHLRS